MNRQKEYYYYFNTEASMLWPVGTYITSIHSSSWQHVPMALW